LDHHDTRGAGNGRYERDIDTAERDAEAARLRARGRTYQQIADELGFSDKSNAHKAVQRTLAAVPVEAAEEVRKLELDKLDNLERAALEVMGRKHVFVQQGHVVRQRIGVERDADGIERLDADGKEIPLYEDVLDDGPTLKAVETLLRVAERRARLLGLDTPVKANVTVHHVDPRDLAIQELLNEARAKTAAEEAALKGDEA
jgi:AraC-like DNA-binding protein